jgi:hypothetical protein
MNLWKIKNYILDYLDNKIDYEYLEDMIIQYSKEKHKSINLDYVKNRIYNLYKLKWILWITEFDILLKHILDLFKIK